MKYLARYVFKVAIAESRITSVDDTHVSFTYRKVHSHRTRTMRLPIFAFLHRFRRRRASCAVSIPHIDRPSFTPRAS